MEIWDNYVDDIGLEVHFIKKECETWSKGLSVTMQSRHNIIDCIPVLYITSLWLFIL